MVYSIFVTHCFVNNSVKGVSVTVFDKDDIQMHGMTYEGKHHKMQQTETKYVQKTFYSLLHYYVISFYFQENCIYYLYRSHASVTHPYNSYN